ncbi:hypothetical protein [Lewinella sp. JB7]|uniref:hypothetical protein n=1 Tax=Lewinella sp. JB7 TaxID=2962887 RepID=UPI0020C96E9D|nr:hypothetical protein [Lewinella sp. JB7]MCP9237418.1 hypothetical protein [Lewinella sp. JB7]
MGRQSTRHRYRSRGEKNRRVARAVRFALLGLLILFIFLLIKHGDEWWAYYRTYFY